LIPWKELEIVVLRHERDAFMPCDDLFGHGQALRITKLVRSSTGSPSFAASWNV